MTTATLTRAVRINFQVGDVVKIKQRVWQGLDGRPGKVTLVAKDLRFTTIVDFGAGHGSFAFKPEELESVGPAIDPFGLPILPGDLELAWDAELMGGPEPAVEDRPLTAADLELFENADYAAWCDEQDAEREARESAVARQCEREAFERVGNGSEE